MVIVDSSVWIDYLTDKINPETSWLSAQMETERIGLTDLSLTEVLQGLRDDSSFQSTQRLLLALPVLDAGGSLVAVNAARNYRFLRAHGITVRKTIDCLIATFCIERNHLLLHRDRDFDPFEQHLGLKVIHA